MSSAPVGSGIAAVAGGLLVFVLIWLTGALSRPREAGVDLSPRLAAIERQLQTELAARPTPASVDPKAIDDLAARMARLESAQSAPRAPVTDPVVLSRLSAAEQAAKALADNVAALARRSDGVEGALRDSQGRLERMSAALNELRTAARSAAAGSDRAARLALAVGSLRVAVERSEPFAGRARRRQAADIGRRGGRGAGAVRRQGRAEPGRLGAGACGLDQAHAAHRRRAAARRRLS